MRRESNLVTYKFEQWPQGEICLDAHSLFTKDIFDYTNRFEIVLPLSSPFLL